METAMEMAKPMENVYVTRREFEEYQRRLEDKKTAWDNDLVEVKTEVKELRELTTSVSQIAQSVKAMVKEQERMAKEQERQGERLGKIENRSGELLWKIVVYLLTAGVGFIFAVLLRRAGIF